MSDPQSTGNGAGRRRRGKRFLSPSEKYEIWVSLIRGEYTIAAAPLCQRPVRRSPSRNQ
jgi:transposase